MRAGYTRTWLEASHSPDRMGWTTSPANATLGRPDIQLPKDPPPHRRQRL